MGILSMKVAEIALYSPCGHVLMRKHRCDAYLQHMLADCALLQANVRFINVGHAAPRPKAAAAACSHHIPDTASASIFKCSWKAEAAQ